jgi:hypothetical protein
MAQARPTPSSSPREASLKDAFEIPLAGIVVRILSTPSRLVARLGTLMQLGENEGGFRMELRSIRKLLELCLLSACGFLKNPLVKGIIAATSRWAVSTDLRIQSIMYWLCRAWPLKVADS